MNKTKFSVIMLIYNTKIEYIDMAIKSILDQDYDNYELILVDDGSKQEVKDYIAQYENNPKFVIYHQENKGMVKSSMQGLKLATGDYIFYVDFDDYINPHSLSICNDIITKYNVDVVMFNHVRFTDNINEVTTIEDYFKEGIVSKQEALKQLCMLHTNTAWSRTGKRELYEGMEEYLNTELINGEDVQQSTYVLLRANSFYYTPEVIYYYRLLEQHRDYYDIKNMNDHNFLYPMYKMIFKDGQNKELLSTFKTSAANSLVYNAFRICLWIKDKKEKTELLNKLNDLETNTITKSIKTNIPLVSKILYYLFIHKHYKLLNLAAKLYDIIYKMEEI